MEDRFRYSEEANDSELGSVVADKLGTDGLGVLSDIDIWRSDVRWNVINDILPDCNSLFNEIICYRSN